MEVINCTGSKGSSRISLWTQPVMDDDSQASCGHQGQYPDKDRSSDLMGLHHLAPLPGGCLTLWQQSCPLGCQQPGLGHSGVSGGGTIKLLEESTDKTFPDINPRNVFLGQSPKAIEIKSFKKENKTSGSQNLRGHKTLRVSISIN